MSEAAEHPDNPQGPDRPRDAARGPEQSGPGSQDGPGAGPPPAERATAPRTTGPDPRPDADGAADTDAWASACAEDLAAERARRRSQHGPPPGSAAEEMRRLLDAVAGKLSGLSGGAAPLIGMAAQGAAQQMVQQAVQQARAAVEPVIERNPDIFDHLAAAGNELLAAYRSAVSAQEQRWTRDTPRTPAAKDSAEQRAEDPADHPKHRAHDDDGDPPDDGPGAGEHIDLD